MDGEILISLTKNHTPTANSSRCCAGRCPPSLPNCNLFPARRHRRPGTEFRPTGTDRCEDIGSGSRRSFLSRLDHCTRADAGAGSGRFSRLQVPNAPALTVDMDRTLANQEGVTQQEAANNVLVATNSSAQTAPNFWVDPRNSVSYPLVVQVPTIYHRLIAGPEDDAGDIGGNSRHIRYTNLTTSPSAHQQGPPRESQRPGWRLLR